MKKLKFVKEESGLWYIDLPEWTGDKAELMMVAGADVFLERIRGGKNEVVLNVDLEPFENSDKAKLVRLGENEGGGHYIIKDFKGKTINLPVWLCDVTKFVFGFIPDEIHFKPV